MTWCAAFWPGGVTLVVRHAASLAWDLGDAFGTVAVRMPLHPVAVELLQRTGPMAVSSANISGQLPATTCDDAQMQLGGDVAVYLDGGQSARGGARPRIVDCTGTRPRLLRAGALTADEIRDVVPDSSLTSTTVGRAPESRARNLVPTERLNAARSSSEHAAGPRPRAS